MKRMGIRLFTICITVFSSCKVNRKPESSPVVDARPQPSAPMPVGPLVLLKPEKQIYIPGVAELRAVQVLDSAITLEKLKDGYFIYSEGACTNCHGVFNIYQYSEPVWKSIIDDMAQRASISDSQKDAVYKYVLSIKATQPK